MKKMFKTAAVLAALLAMTNFIACSSGDDDNNEPSSGTGTESSTTGGDSSSSDSGSSSGSGSESSGTDSGSSGDSSSTGGDSSTTTTYANTYWVQEDDVDEDEGTTTTTKAYSYIFLTSETEGSYYYATFPSGTVTTTTVEGTYSAAESFTYAVSGTTITGTLNESAITGTIASDGSSITLNMPVSATETTAIKFNKASAAPEKPVITITTSGSTGGETTLSNYTLDLSSFPESVAASSSKIDDTVTVYASASTKKIQGKTTYVQMTGGKAVTTSGSEYGLALTLEANATVTITALSKESKTACQWMMLGMNGETDVTSTGTPAVANAKSDVTTTAPATLTFENVPAGTYMLGAKSDGGYLCSLTITY